MQIMIYLCLLLSAHALPTNYPMNLGKALNYKNVLPKITYNQLLKKIENKDISQIGFTKTLDNVIVENKENEGRYDDFSLVEINPFLVDHIAEEAVNNDITTIFMQAPPPSALDNIGNLLGNLMGPFIIYLLISFFVNNAARNQMGGNSPMGPMGPFGGGRRDVTKDKFDMQKANVSLASFAGSEEIMLECTEVVSYLKNATIYQNAGADIPKGVLLEGPPGTGKTLLAKAIASEADANFISIAASEFVEIFVGMGASKIRSLFQTARTNKPCIIFIDEIDAVGRQRGGGGSITGSNDEREQTLNQLLAEMDGFANNEGILVIAATNRKDVLDQALLRPGRFDRILTVPYPDRVSRNAILKVHAKNKQLDPLIHMEFIAEMTAGFSGAQLKNLLNEAAIYAARDGRAVITEKNILDALEKTIVGIIKQRDTRSDEAKRRVAIHEIGHAYLAKYYSDYFELKKVTIQSTYNGAGGYTLFNEYQNIIDAGLYTKDLLQKRLVITMGGKAAESIFYGDQHVSLGAIQDLKEANSLAKKMIVNYGMGDKLNVFYNENSGNENVFSQRSYSERLKDQIDKETMGLVMDAYTIAKQVLMNNQNTTESLVNQLLEETTILGPKFII
jgi:cell division protease FtsH